MVSYFEVGGLDAGALRLAIGPGSRSEENLKLRGRATLALVDSSGAYYLKATATPEEDVVGLPFLTVFRLTLQEVAMDEVGHGAEESAELTSGITFRSPDESLRHRQSVRRALLTA